MLSPKRMKFRKYHRGKMRGKVHLCLFYIFRFNLSFYLLIYFVNFNYSLDKVYFGDFGYTI